MTGFEGQYRFYVEGTDDFHAILNLLRKYGLSREETPDFPRFRPPTTETGHGSGQGYPAVLEAIEPAVKTNSSRSVGFVLDADANVQSRWQAVVHQLRKVDVDVGAGIDARGFVGWSEGYQTRVGVWLMPDNERSGTLEDFLEDLVDEASPLLPHAREATRVAKEDLGAMFADQKTIKAELHSWLAWQAEPGRPYGTAIASEYLRHDSEAAVRFVSWFRRLFGLDG